jgi:outer membrane protein assembly factor BamE
MRIRIILFSLLLASCSGQPTTLLTPYKMDIRQGNYVTPDMRENLKIGMTKAQVRYVLGTPMINDVFHGNRWDYVYRLERDGKVIEKQDMTLYFEGENLARVVDGNQSAGTSPAKSEAQK